MVKKKLIEVKQEGEQGQDRLHGPHHDGYQHNAKERNVLQVQENVKVWHLDHHHDGRHVTLQVEVPLERAHQVGSYQALCYHLVRDNQQLGLDGFNAGQRN